MKVKYRATGDVADLEEEAARVLIDACICEAVDDTLPRDAALLTPEAPLNTAAVVPGKRRRAQ